VLPSIPRFDGRGPRGYTIGRKAGAGIQAASRRAGHPDRAGHETAFHVRNIPLLAPAAIAASIRGAGYVGQERAVRAIALGAYRHVQRLRRIHLEGVPVESLPPKAPMLFVGPTGCGKTFLVEILFRDILRLPTVVVDMTGFSETGYVGQDTASLLTRLLYAADMDLAHAAIGVVCLDEFDKLSSGQNSAVFAGQGTTKDVSGLGVQRELLKMLEAIEMPVPLEYTHADYAPKAIMSTRDVGFIACGAFSGLKGVIERAGAEHIGFGREPLSGAQDRIAVSYAEDEVELARTFMNYGFLPELIGRFKRIVPFSSLDRTELAAILRTRVLGQYATEFRLEGRELSIDEAVLDTVVEETLKKETGARGLEAALARHLEDAAFESWSDPDGRRVRLRVADGKIVHELG
jgi:ATP-dependent Clp protease ATP-binding subunit ClpX